MIKVSITTKDGSVLIADDSTVDRQGTAVYKQICNKEDVLFKDSNGHTILIPFVNIVEANVSVSDAPIPTPSVGVRKQVAFFDYDGTITNTYDVDEFAALTELPVNPSHDGLIAQGWNWTLADAKEYLQKYPMGDMNIGQTYITESGDTEIDIELVDPVRLNPYLGICIDGEVEVDWGDGSEKETITGTSFDPEDIVNTPHTYSETGEYTITIHVVSGSFVIANTGSRDKDRLLNSNSNYGNQAYYNAVRAVRLGSGVDLGDEAFWNVLGLELITIPDSVTYIGTNAFCGTMVRSITIPVGVTSIGSCAFCDAQLLELIAIPNGVTEILDWAFDCCYNLRSLTIPDSVIFIDEGAFEMTYALNSIVIPDGITRIEDDTFTESSIKNLVLPDGLVFIGDGAFKFSKISFLEIPSGVTEIGKTALGSKYLTGVKLNEGLETMGDYVMSASDAISSLIIPSTVTQVGKMAFQMTSLLNVHLKPTTPPIIGNDPFHTIENLVIYVPYSEDHSILAAYQSATNWSAYASYMQEEPA